MGDRDVRWVRLLLDEFSHAVADATDHAGSRELVLAATVDALEGLTGASLGTTAGEPSVVLARRFSRAHRRLLAEPDRLAGHEAELRALLGMLRGDGSAEERTRQPVAAVSTSHADDPVVEPAR